MPPNNDPVQPSTKDPSLKTASTPKMPLNSDGHCQKGGQSVWSEAGNIVLLITLYCLQGIPLGLSMGSMPFLLQEKSSFTSIGLFGIAAYPYSCKLLWSPIVDSVYSRRIGRRKSWILPLQTLSAIVLVLFADTAEVALNQVNIGRLAAVFFVLVLLAAMQDIAVDGWALRLLSRRNLGYTSMCQTVGMNAGFFLSFTVFLALNDNEFCNKYFRTVPDHTGLLTLAGYMKCSGMIYGIVTILIAILKEEKEETDGVQQSLLESYRQLWNVVKLAPVLRLTSVLLLCRLGGLVAEGAGTLKLLEKGVSKEAVSGIILLEFPVELLAAVVAGRWVAGEDALAPFLKGYHARLAIATISTYIVFAFPVGASSWSDHPWAFLVVLCAGIVTSCAATVMFTAQGAFFSQVSDPKMGGAYLTLLNTLSNLGSSLPRLIVFWMMDQLTVRQCSVDGEWKLDLSCPSKKDDALAANACTNAGGVCEITQDGFYPLSLGLILLGLILGRVFSRIFAGLRRLPIEAWRAKHQKET